MPLLGSVRFAFCVNCAVEVGCRVIDSIQSPSSRDLDDKAGAEQGETCTTEK